MKEAKIKFILVQIDEAHSTAWPIGLANTPEPQKSFEERVNRANAFINSDKPDEPFVIKIDGWNNIFAETFHAWPDIYYLIDKKYKVLARSEYGTEDDNDALIKVDCTKLICELIKK